MPWPARHDTLGEMLAKRHDDAATCQPSIVSHFEEALMMMTRRQAMPCAKIVAGEASSMPMALACLRAQGFTLRHCRRLPIAEAACRVWPKSSQHVTSTAERPASVAWRLAASGNEFEIGRRHLVIEPADRSRPPLWSSAAAWRLLLLEARAGGHASAYRRAGSK